MTIELSFICPPEKIHTAIFQYCGIDSGFVKYSLQSGTFWNACHQIGDMCANHPSGFPWECVPERISPQIPLNYMLINFPLK